MGHCILPKTFPDLWGISIYFLWAIQSTVYCYCSPNRHRHSPPHDIYQLQAHRSVSRVLQWFFLDPKVHPKLQLSYTSPSHYMCGPWAVWTPQKSHTRECIWVKFTSCNLESEFQVNALYRWLNLFVPSKYDGGNGDKGSTVVGIARGGAYHSSTCTVSFGAELQGVDISWLVFYSVLPRDFSPSRASFRTSSSISPEITHVKQGSHHPLTHRKLTTLLRAKTTPRRGRRKCIP